MSYRMHRDFCQLITIEALYQVIAAEALTKHVLITREQFLGMSFPVVTTVDGLVAIVQRGLAVNLLMQTPAHGDGRRIPRFDR